MISKTRFIPIDTRGEMTRSSLSSMMRANRKWPISYRSIEAIVICGDLFAILIASIVSTLLFPNHDVSTATDIGRATGSAIIVSALCVSLLKTRSMHTPAALLDLGHQVHAVCLCWAVVFLLLGAAVSAFNLGSELFRSAGAIFPVLGLMMLIGQRVFVRALVLKGLSEGKFSGGNVILLTDQAPSRETGLARTLTALGFRVGGSFCLPRTGASSNHRKRLIDLVIRHARGTDIEEVIVEADPNRWHELREFIADLRVLPIPVVFVPVGAGAEMFGRPTRDFRNAVGVEVQRRPLTHGERAAKRCIDVIGAGVCLILLTPPLLLIAAAIRLDSAGPVLFRQQRCGFNGRSFTIYKFRTMRVMEDGCSITQAVANDCRVTKIGRWLRRTSVDELPQLLNVLEGSMSLVGPRPHAIAHDTEFDLAVQQYAYRRRVKPGLTGWAQIHGSRGPTPTRQLIEQRVTYDLWYIDNWSLQLDLAILLRTPMEVLRSRNAF
ncbi:exopolysaccharide biosynthesis polyprenyl glycosylphosphotransferase [Bradyrhizobium japonicum]|uniref:Exopolysaccharide biosynthesis polyprenyl glycosylphosphotransferase n=1 Tax=Bradyrhizobium japonicum TaxID=375 RepID=A0A0A3XWC7_BRAJP|nr:exopolysaccharide biosynthesis polyprenyl glycosylphosphotransferase [Bradyrhizobium japonicum]KGT78767.1 exopolysaccharide biosynthesis polyprenyl glycosylphosphotransferase [Bradyrhizobium japonicum]MCS3897866.1 putative colanic acid biosynthesis UDP-glucose lipid carrier transferase [Bradyrhizobium japonicum USDA 38]MCS3940920.1 putative colanic acid biosynthesis UDP-glucose lipid carrier transferase [Bradyrhizobium japonicum]MCW2217023.1 putative colanic acid biosynthesis UDP-glucose lip